MKFKRVNSFFPMDYLMQALGRNPNPDCSVREKFKGSCGSAGSKVNLEL
jgi:hypothetical protein